MTNKQLRDYLSHTADTVEGVMTKNGICAKCTGGEMSSGFVRLDIEVDDDTKLGRIAQLIPSFCQALNCYPVVVDADKDSWFVMFPI